MTVMTDERPDVADLLASQEAMAERIAGLGEQLRSVGARLEDIEDRLVGGGEHAGGKCKFPTLELWVDNVYARLAARHDPVWCTNWTAHDEAVRRLKSLWETWEQANASEDPRDLADWLLRFDQYGAILHSPEGTFRSCRPGQRCDPPPKLGALRKVLNLVTFRPANRGAQTS